MHERNGLDGFERVCYALAGAGIATILLAIGYGVGRWW